MKRLDLVRRLQQAGFVLLRHGGRHDIFENPQTGDRSRSHATGS